MTKVARIQRTILLLSLAVAATGCMATAKGTIMQIQPVAAKIDASKAAHFVFSGPTETNKVQLVSSARSSVYSAVSASGVFNSLQSNSQGAAYSLTVTILEVNTVSTAARVLAGVFAGRNRISGSVSVVEIASGRTIASFTAVGESAAHPYSSEAGIQDAVAAFSQQVVMGLKQ